MIHNIGPGPYSVRASVVPLWLFGWPPLEVLPDLPRWLRVRLCEFKLYQ